MTSLLFGNGEAMAVEMRVRVAVVMVNQFMDVVRSRRCCDPMLQAAWNSAHCPSHHAATLEALLSLVAVQVLRFPSLSKKWMYE